MGLQDQKKWSLHSTMTPMLNPTKTVRNDNGMDLFISLNPFYVIANEQ